MNFVSSVFNHIILFNIVELEAYRNNLWLASILFIVNCLNIFELVTFFYHGLYYSELFCFTTVSTNDFISIHMFMEESSKVPTRDSMNSGFGYDPIDPENIVPLNHDSSVDIVYSTFILGVGVPLGLAMNRLHQHHFMLRPTSILKTWKSKGF
jgi:hypothetical protein